MQFQMQTLQYHIILIIHNIVKRTFNVLLSTELSPSWLPLRLFEHSIFKLGGGFLSHLPSSTAATSFSTNALYIVAWWHKWYKWPIPLSVVSQLFFLSCDKMYKGQTNFWHFYMLDLCTIVNSLFLKYCSNKKDKIVLCLIQYILWYDTNFMAGTEILLRLDIF